MVFTKAAMRFLGPALLQCTARSRFRGRRGRGPEEGVEKAHGSLVSPGRPALAVRSSRPGGRRVRGFSPSARGRRSTVSPEVTRPVEGGQPDGEQHRDQGERDVRESRFRPAAVVGPAGAAATRAARRPVLVVVELFAEHVVVPFGPRHACVTPVRCIPRALSFAIRQPR